MRSVLWSEIAHVADFANSSALIVHMILTVVIVSAVCSGIEYIRSHSLEKFFSIAYDNIERRIQGMRKPECGKGKK